MSIMYHTKEVNETIVVENWGDFKYLRELMDKYGETKFPFFGNNQNDEDVEIHICPDTITLITYQSNHWIRKNVYYRDGSSEELYQGKWE